jgi:hypothetical protein
MSKTGVGIFMRLAIHYPRTTLSIVILALLLLSPFLFAKWKAQNLQSYAALEIMGAFATIILILPWDRGILDIESYSSFLDIRKALPLLGAIYFGVRGVENWNKAVPRVR